MADNKDPSANKYIKKLWKFTFISDKTINDSLVAFCYSKVVFENLQGILPLNKLLSSLRSGNMMEVFETSVIEETG